MSNWYANPVNHPYIPEYESGVFDTPHYAEDIGTPFHSTITALLPGTVEKADYQPWGGEVFIKPDDTSYPEYYYYHLDDNEVSVGQHIAAGQMVGLSGGQTSGGDHPVQNTATTTYSTGPHTHVGYFTEYTTPSETGYTIPYGPDITPLINAAVSNGIGNGGASPPPGGSSTQTTNLSLNPLDAIGTAVQQFETWLTNSIGGFLVRMAIGGVGIGLVFLGSKELLDALKNVPESYQKSRGSYQRSNKKPKTSEEKPKEEKSAKSEKTAEKAVKTEKKVETAEKVAEVAAA